MHCHFPLSSINEIKFLFQSVKYEVTTGLSYQRFISLVCELFPNHISSTICNYSMQLHRSASYKGKVSLTRKVSQFLKYLSWSQVAPYKCLKYCYMYIKVRNRTKIRNRYNQEPHLTQDIYVKVTHSLLDITNESQEVSPFPAGDHKPSKNKRARKHNGHL